MKKETYKIYEMLCSSCVGFIEGAILKTKGVSLVFIDFDNESVLIEFDENVVSAEKLAEVVKSIGYTLEIGDRKEKQAVDKTDL